jgi:hypothetical protein
VAVNGKDGRVWKKVIMVYWQFLSHHLTMGNERADEEHKVSPLIAADSVMFL